MDMTIIVDQVVMNGQFQVHYSTHIRGDAYDQYDCQVNHDPHDQRDH